MTPIYVKTGVLFRDSITIQDPSGAYVTGLVNGDFTKQLSNGTTGNLSVSGITVTQVDASNNPGVYDLLVPATIFATNGNYTLKVYRTADTTYSWSQEFVATQDGTPGSTGTLSFTSTSGDGRVVDTGATGIPNARVYITQGSYLVALTTDASGDWGPWYADPSAGSFTVTVFASGYTQATGTLTVGASSITGPGSNLVLTAVSTGSTVSAGELWSYARRMSGNKPGTQANTKILQLVNDSIDRLAQERNWNFYLRRAYLQLNEPYSSGTLTLTNGSTTATLAGGTWPTWAALGRLFAQSLILDIASRTNGTTLVLSAPWGGATNTYDYTLFQNRYDLPENFLVLGGIMEGQNWPYRPEPVSIEVLWQWENALAIGTPNAQGYAIAFNQMWLWPYPTVSQSIAYWFKARPAPLVIETDLADVDATWLNVLHKLIDYNVAVYFGECVAGTAEQCLARYLDSLARLPANDKSTQLNAPVTGGFPRNLPLWRSRSL